MRTLLLHQKGASSYEELRRTNGIQHDSFRDVCVALDLLADDTGRRNALRESYASRFHPITELFALILVHCQPSNPLQVWSDYASLFISDILHRYRGASSALIRLLLDSDAENHALLEVKKALELIGNASLSDFGLPLPTDLPPLPQEIQAVDEHVKQRQEEVSRAFPHLSADQKFMFYEVVGTVLPGVTADDLNAAVVRAQSTISKALFLDAPAGTGKTF